MNNNDESAFRMCGADLDEQNAEVDVLGPGGRAARQVEDDVLCLGARRQYRFQRVGQLQHRGVRDSDQRGY